MHFKASQRFRDAIAAFDALNAEDPNRILVDGRPTAKELHDALAMTRWLDALYPDADEAAHLAARCQHLCRWEVPRASYPEGRVGYLKWRSDLKKRHAEKAASVLQAHGYEAATIEAVRQINLKQGLKQNLPVQQIEDALCLVFLETQFEGYIDQWDREKIIRILRKTWGKMSEAGQGAALRMEHSGRAAALLQAALEPDD